MFYILDDQQQAIAEPSLLKWVMWRESENTIIRETTTSTEDTIIITEFTGNDRYLKNGKPLLFETRVEVKKQSKQVIRAADYQTAIAAHNKMLAKLSGIIEA